ncbi:hypothetical protein [Streptomyces sp. RB13]|uniref:hypothetical protein n=1 Tax=Streptomyces sp. RB13 TaxID=2950978 RepID=UPI002FCA402D|nr:hypothetical protein OHA15_34125 [Streptomyces anthocyanicus]
MNTHPEALLTTSLNFGRLAAPERDEGAATMERRYDQLQARALNNLDDTYAGDAGSEDQVAMLARAQVHALLTAGAAIKDLAAAIRENR